MIKDKPKTILLALAMLASFVADAQIGDTTSAAKYYNGYLQERRSDHHDQALAYLKQATTYYERARAWQRMVEAYQEQISFTKSQGKWAEPKQIQGQMRQKVKLIIRQSEAKLVEAETFEKQGLLQQAAMIYEEILKLKSVLLESGETDPDLAEEQYHLGKIYYKMEADIKALKYLLLAADGLEIIGGDLRFEAAEARQISAELFEKFDNLGKASQQIDQAAALYMTSAQHREQLASALLKAGYYHQEDGELGQALTRYLQAFDLFDALKDKEGLAQSAISAGDLYVLRGAYRQAADYFDLAKKYDHTGAMLRLGRLQMRLGDYASAISTLRKTISNPHADKAPQAQVVLAYLSLGEADVEVAKADQHDRADKLEKAMQRADEAESLAKGEQRAQLYVLRGDIAMLQNRLAEADRYYSQAQNYYRQSDTRKGILLATARFKHYQLLWEKGDRLMALRKLDEGLCALIPSCQRLGKYDQIGVEEAYDHFLLFRILKERARALEEEYGLSKDPADLQAAFQSFIGVDKTIGLIRSGQDSESDKFALAKLSADFYQTAVKMAFKLAEYEWAYHFSERSKAAILLESVAGLKARQVSNIPQKLIQQERNLRAEIAAFKRKRAEFYGNQEKVAYYQNKIVEAERRMAILDQQVEQQFPKYHQLKNQQELPAISQIQQLLDPNTWVIEYFSTPDQLFVFHISQNHFKAYAYPVNEEFFKQQKGFRNAIIYKIHSFYTELGHQLYRQLFRETIPEEVGKLIIIPDGHLALMPFEALLTSEVSPPPQTSFRQMPYLIRRFDITYAPSGAMLYLLMNSPSNAQTDGILVTAPVFDFKAAPEDDFHTGIPPLYASVSETDEIKQRFEQNGQQVTVWMRKEANETQLKNTNLANYRYLHFATHGFVNDENPTESGLVLSGSSEGQDGVLYQDEIFRLNLQAEMVTLSACETGAGKVSPGEGIIGLTRAFIYAGARNLNVSLWKVSDASTARLLSDFWTNVLRLQKAEQRNGFSAQGYGNSLKISKMLLIDSEKYAAPYYWSPFILIGK